MLRESVVVVRTRPRAIPLAMRTMRISTHGFPFASHMGMGLRLAALRAAGAPPTSSTNKIKLYFQVTFLLVLPSSLLKFSNQLTQELNTAH